MSANSLRSSNQALAGRLFQAGQDSIVSTDVVTDILLEALKSGRSVSDVIEDREVLSRRQREAIRELLTPSMAMADESQQTIGSGSVSGSKAQCESVPTPLPSGHRDRRGNGQFASSGDQQFPVGFERFESSSELGRGGWGVVVRAHDRQLHRDVAVKQLGAAAKTDPDVARRFLHEARVTGQLQHPGIVPVYERGLSPETQQPFYAMKLLDGVTLRQLIRDYHSCPRAAEKQSRFHRLLDCFIDVCRAVGYAHSQGIIHRDLKPANIVCGDFGETVVVDWGLARILDDPSAAEPVCEETAVAGTPMVRTPHGGSGDNLLDPVKTQRGSVFGTPAYMSPEQARGATDEITTTSDTYSLGVILYVMLTGQPPFHADDIVTTLRKVVEGRYQHPRAINRSVPAALAAICVKAMARAPISRYQNGNEMAEDLTRYLSSEKVHAHQENQFETVVRWCRRRPTFATALFLGVSLLTLCTTVTAVAIRQAHHAEREAKEEALAAHAAEQQARRQAQSARKVAIQRLDQSRAAADSWLIDLSAALERFPGLSPVRTELIQGAARHYQDLYDSIPVEDESGEERLEAARCLLRLGDLRILLGQVDTATQYFDQALTQLDATGFPREDIKLQQSGARERFNAEIGLALCALNQQSVTQEYVEGFHETARKFENVSLTSHDVDQRSSVARGLFVSARLYHHLGRSEDSLSLLREALQQAEFLVSLNAGSRHQHLHTAIRTVLIETLIAVDRISEAVSQLDSQIETLSERLPSGIRRPDLLESRAVAGMLRAGLLLEQGQFWAAEQGYSAAVDDFSESWQLFYGDHFFCENLAIAEANLGQLVMKSGQLERAEQMLRNAIDQLTGLLQSEQADRATVSRLALCNTSLSDLLVLQCHESAEAHLHRSLQVFDSLQQQEELTDAERLARGRLLLNSGALQLFRGHEDSAVAELQTAISFLRESSDLPDTPATGLLVARGQDLLSRAYDRLEQTDEAMRSRDQALEHLRLLADSQDVGVQISATHQLIRLLTSARSGKAELSEAAELLERLPVTPQSEAEISQLRAILAYRHQDPEGLQFIEQAMAGRRFPKSVDMAIRGCFFALKQDQVKARESLQTAEMGMQKRPGDVDLREWMMELSARIVEIQDRVATSVEEIETPDFTTCDLRFYKRHQGWLFTSGIENITDKYDREHLDNRSGRGADRPGVNFYSGMEVTD